MRCPALCLTLLATGCVETQDPELPIEPAGVSVPITTVEVFPGVEASFYVWDDLSAGILVMSSNGSPLLDEHLEGLSVSEAFWALSAKETPVPELLLQHHEALVVDGEHPPWAVVTAEREQGWVRALPRPRALAACVGGTFWQHHCVLGNGYTARHCALDNNGSWKTDVFERRRFKAGFCIDAGGDVFDQLAWTDYCSQTGAFIWLGLFPSQWYASWEWIAPSSANPRRWLHQGSGWIDGSARDWGSKFDGFQPDCPYEPYL